MSRDKKRSHKQSSQQRSDLRRATHVRINALFSRAMDSHRAGDLEHAKRLYRETLRQDREHAPAMHLLGFAEFQSRNYASAIEHIRAAVRVESANAEFHNNLALALLAAKRFEDAEQHAQIAAKLGHRDSHGYRNVAVEFLQYGQYDCAERAIRLGLIIQGPSAESHHYLGLVYSAQQRHAEAEACFREALALCPDFLEALNNLGNALRDQNKNDDAIPYYQKALGIEPTFAAAHNNLGVALANQGQAKEAIACYERAIRLQSGFAEAWNNLGNAHRDLGQLEIALEHYRQALEFQPHSAEIQSNYAVALRRVGKLTDAIGYFRRAIVLQPRSVKIHSHLASALVEQDKLAEAVACVRHTGRIDADQPLWQLQAAAICPTIFSSRDEMEHYTAALRDQIRSLANTNYPFELTTFTNVAPAAPFNLQFLAHCICDIKIQYASLFAANLDKAYRARWVETWKRPTARPRIGFVVTEDHEGIFVKSLQGVLARLSVRDFQLAVFCSHRGCARVRTAIGRDDVEMIPLPTHLHQIARAIDESHCDLLYYWETGTDAFSYFLPFLRLSPIQMTSWGIQVTSGIPNVDYYLSNQLVEPHDAAGHYSEQLLLADTLLTYRPRTQLPPTIQSKESFGLPVDRNWYVCAQQLGKFHIDFDDMIAAVLRCDERGIVILTGDRRSQQVQRLQQRLERSCPDVVQRIHFAPRLETSAYLSLLHHANVLLDPPHFGGVNSTYDGLSLGKAIVVLPSRFHRGRYTLGCYRKMGFLDCVAGSVAEYARIAVRLGTDADYRQHVERTIADASSVLFEDYQAVLEHERLFHELLNR